MSEQKWERMEIPDYIGDHLRMCMHGVRIHLNEIAKKPDSGGEHLVAFICTLVAKITSDIVTANPDKTFDFMSMFLRELISSVMVWCLDNNEIEMRNYIDSGNFKKIEEEIKERFEFMFQQQKQKLH